jgi:hypothetical protein
MTPQEIQIICDLLSNRVQPQSAREGAAIMQLVSKLAASITKPVPEVPNV